LSAAKSEIKAVKMDNITKTFGGVKALDNVNFEVGDGEIRGMVGENGAGKSTLMKILSGVHTEYIGEMFLWGKRVEFNGTADAANAGIGMIYQELSVIDCLTVAENNFLGKQPINKLRIVKWKEINRIANEHLKSLGINLDVSLPLNLLPFSIRQMVEIAKIIFSGAKIIIMDEPTSSLSHTEVEQLFQLIRTLKEKGNTIIFISHLIEDVIEISDSITILKDGRVVNTLENKNLSKHDIIHSMVGITKGHLVREADEIVKLSSPKSDIIMEIKDLTKEGNFKDVSFNLRKGEILGLYGLLEAGQEDVGRAIFGLKNYDTGTIKIEGKLLPKKCTHKIKDLGIAYISEERKKSLFHRFEIYKNITLPYLKKIFDSKLNWLLKNTREITITNHQIRDFSIKTSGPKALLGSLSGGNQQKVALAKWLTVPPKVIIFQEPTRGVDVGAKAEIVQSIRNLKKQGLSCIVISMEPETILDLSDRVLIFSRGKIVHEMNDTKTSKIKLMEIA